MTALRKIYWLFRYERERTFKEFIILNLVFYVLCFILVVLMR